MVVVVEVLVLVALNDIRLAAHKLFKGVLDDLPLRVDELLEAEAWQEVDAQRVEEEVL